MKSADEHLPNLTTSWGRMAYVRGEGAGTPLVLLHGTGCSIADWQGTVARLPAGVPYLALDFRGHGQSTVPTAPFSIEDLAGDVLDLLSHLGLASVWLVGHSLGGMVALEAAGRSEGPCGLVLLEGWTRLSAMPAAFEVSHHYGSLDAEAIARIQAKLSATRARFDPALWAHFWASVECFDASRYLARLAIPIWEVYGAMGQRREAQSRLAVPQRPNIRWLWIPSAGHYLPHECPHQVAAACLGALSA